MSANIGILYENLSDASTVTLAASHESGDRTAAKLQNIDVTNIWRANSLSPYLTVNFGSAKLINAIAVINTNFTNGATWRIRAATSEANLTASPGFDSGNVSAWPAASGTQIRNNVNPFYFINGGAQFQWWRIDFADSGNTDLVLDAGRLVMGNAFQPKYNADFGLRLGIRDLATSTRTRGGQPDFDKIGKLRTIEFALSLLSTSEAVNSVFDMQALNGISTDVLVFPLPLEDTENFHANVIWGPMRELTPIETRAMPARRMRWLTRISVEERI